VGFTYSDSYEAQCLILPIVRAIRPMAVKGYRKIRTGRISDGGYVMLNDFLGIHAAYSLGISDDVSWDSDMAMRDIDVWQYDHTIERVPYSHPRFHWIKLGISSRAENGFETLPNLIERNGHSASDLILKCDIEGAEWDVFSSMTPSQIAPFKQIIIETHGWGHIVEDQTFADRVAKAIENLTANHKVIHAHANNCAAYCIIGGVPVPAVLELTFVRERDYEIVESAETFPTRLDASCTSKHADLQLGHFKF
jgi:hypothetical protein